MEWLTKPVYFLYAVLGSYLVYILSFGPVLLLVGASPSSGPAGLPPLVRILYGPVDLLIPDKFSNVYDWYLGLFTRVEG